MKLTKKLALCQLKRNPARTAWTVAGIVLSTAMITAVFGFAASGDAMLRREMGENDFYVSMYNSMLFGLSAVFVSIIVSASVVVVSNAFRVSAGERAAQFGILKSAGATKKQIAATIMHESIMLCAASIPPGVGLGLLVNLAGMGIANYFLTGLNELSGRPLVLDFVFSWQAMLLAAAVSFGTVCLSAWLPASKAARIAAVDAIRGAGEIKVNEKNEKKARVCRSAQKIFGFEGTLAIKSLKRSRRNFRASTLSLTVSVALYITVGAFGMMMDTLTTVFFPGVDANVVGRFYSYYSTTQSEDGQIIIKYQAAVNSSLADEITSKLREYPETSVYGAGSDIHSYMTYIPVEMLSARSKEIYSHLLTGGENELHHSVVLTVLDSKNYAAVCLQAGVPYGSNILVNQSTFYESEGRTFFAPLIFNGQSLQLYNLNDGGVLTLMLNGVLGIGEIADEILSVSGGLVNIIVPELDALNYAWFAKTSDAAGFAAHMESALDERIAYGSELCNVSVFNIEAEQDATKDIVRLIMVFVYGFIAMLTLVVLTNVISTITANIRSRAREFAVLRSVGMTTDGLRRMLNAESLLCSGRSLAAGVPIGLACSYIIHNF
ncbi:MAG: ABC transporter permease [Defluviitaleaceae bacterium]|nr:ABC transporter permease [Defluviitaleaceae bacterium]